MSKHPKRLVHLVQAYRLLPLLKIADEAQPESRPKRELFLRQPCRPALCLEKSSDRILGTHQLILYPIGDNIKRIVESIP